MKHSWKKELARVMEAPAPLRKKEFIRTFEQADIGFCECILIQAGYIRRWVWAASLFVCFAAFLGPLFRKICSGGFAPGCRYWR